MAKAEIGWQRVTAEGRRVQVYAQRVSKDWRFFVRERRYERWQPLPQPPLEDWLRLLDAVQRLVHRRRMHPEDEARLRQRIRERFPEEPV